MRRGLGKIPKLPTVADCEISAGSVDERTVIFLLSDAKYSPLPAPKLT